jgi:hypothetical protein
MIPDRLGRFNMTDKRIDSVVLVHGTFAAAQDDMGPRWWQRGSAFANWLNRRLDGVAECHDVFHWSGQNRERERQRAGRQLLERLHRYGREGRRYHLVGHSHGGSVIWAALRRAALRGETLPGLRSWVTVGTPFLSYRVRKGDLLLALPLALASLAMLAHVGQVVVASQYAGAMRAAGYRWTLPLLAALWLLTAVCLLYCAFRVGAVAWAAYNLRRERRAGTKAIDAFGDRWLGLWSGEDEAINGLRSTLGLGGLTYRDKPLRVLPRTPLPLFAGLGDRLFFEWLKRFLQGNDRISQSLAEVAPTPRTADAFIAAPLTVADNEVLIARVARGVSLPRTLDRLRRVIGQVAYGGALQSPFEPEEGETAPVFNSLLVHTVYLPEADDGDEVMPIPKRIAEFLEGRSGPAPAPATAATAVVVATPAGDGHAVAAVVNDHAPADGRTEGGVEAAVRVAKVAGLWRRFYAATAVQRTLVYALVGIVLISWAGSTAMFDRVRQLTPEARMAGLIATAPEVDAAEDGNSNSALATWALALFEAEARGPELRSGSPGPLDSLGLPTVPAVFIAPGRPEKTLTHIENPLRMGEAFIATAEALARAVPPRRELAGRLADRAGESIASVAPASGKKDGPPAPNANPGRFPPDPAGYAVATVRLAKLQRQLDAGDGRKLADAVAGAEAVIRVAQAEVDKLKKGVVLVGSPENWAPVNLPPPVPVEGLPPAPPPPPATSNDEVIDDDVIEGASPPVPVAAPQPAARNDAPAPPGPASAPAPRGSVRQAAPAPPPPPSRGSHGPVSNMAAQQVPVRNLPIPQSPVPRATSPAAQAVAPTGLPAAPSAPTETVTVSFDPESAAWATGYGTRLTSADTSRLIDAQLDALDELRVMGQGERAGDAVVRFLDSIGDVRAIEASKSAVLNQPGGVTLLFLSLAQTARLGVLIRELGLERGHPGAVTYARNSLNSQSIDPFINPIDDATAAAADLISLGLRDPLLVAADRWLAKYQGKTAMFRQVDPEALVKVARLYLAAGQPDRAAEAARGILNAFRLIQPPNVLVEQAKQITQETLHVQKQKEIDAYACRRVRLRCAVARLGLPAHPRRPGDAKSLLEAAWTEGLPVVELATEGANGADCVVPLAEVFGAASDLSGVDAAPARAAVANLYLKALDGSSKLKSMGTHAPEMGRTLRLLSEALLNDGGLDLALRLADAIPRDADRIAARLVVADRLAHDGLKSRARQIVVEDEPAIGKLVPYRSDRSPLMAGCAVIWARLGETNRGVLARESCLARDHLRADTALLMLFALPSRAKPPYSLRQPAAASRTPPPKPIPVSGIAAPQGAPPPRF